MGLILSRRFGVPEHLPRDVPREVCLVGSTRSENVETIQNDGNYQPTFNETSCFGFQFA